MQSSPARVACHYPSPGIRLGSALAWLEEVAPKQKQFQAIRRKLIEENEGSTPGLFRLASKMATGSGKTTVMAWQTVNAVKGRTSFSDAVLDYAEAMTRADPRVEDEQVERLRSYFDDDRIVELTGLVTFQNMSSKFNSALGVPAQGFCKMPSPAMSGPSRG